MPIPYQICSQLQKLLDDTSVTGDDRRFRVMELCRQAHEAVCAYEGGDYEIVRAVVFARIGAAQTAAGV